MTIDGETLRLGTPCNVGAGSLLASEGVPGRETYYVVEGTARVIVEGRIVAHIGPGEFVGEMALIDHGARSATVVAQSPMRVLSFDPTHFSALLDDPGVSRALLRGLVARLRAVQRSSP